MRQTLPVAIKRDCLVRPQSVHDDDEDSNDEAVVVVDVAVVFVIHPQTKLIIPAIVDIILFQIVFKFFSVAFGEKSTVNLQKYFRDVLADTKKP